MAASEAKQYAQRNRQGSDWFTHEKQPEAEIPAPPPAAVQDVVDADQSDAVPATQRTQMIKPKCDSNQWYKYDGPNEEQKVVPMTEGGNYCRRDKAGSASEWFSHDHTDGSAAAVDNGQKSELQREGSANAARMRSESDSWFTHEKTGNQSGGAVTSGAVTSGQKGAGTSRPVSNEMHGIFHHGD